MNLEFYENLPETMSREEVEILCVVFFRGVNENLSDMELASLDILADKQWHTYELPSMNLCNVVGSWLDRYCDSSDVSPDVVMRIAYCFGLKKTFFENISEKYGGDLIGDYCEDLEMSQGDFIDPYWSLRK